MKLTFFDFDDAAYKHFISDIAIILYYHFIGNTTITKTEYNQKCRFILENLLIGYRKENEIDTHFLRNLNDFLLLRSTVLYIVLVASGALFNNDTRRRNLLKVIRERTITNWNALDLDYVLKGL